jgi:hypothetical protein
MLSPLSHCVAVVFALGLAIFGFSETVQAQDGPCDCPDWNDRPVKEITDNDGAGIGTVTWSCDTVYILTEPVFVNPGDILTIAPGTLVKGRTGIVFDTLTYTLPNGNPSPREDYVYSQHAGSLVVSAGATIYAEGTADCPIVFTFEADPMDGSVGYDVRGEWGGLIVCGNGALNTFDGNDEVEGVVDYTGQGRHIYGGDDPQDASSGMLRFISLRHASTSLGISQFGNGIETNALTLCGVGNGTTVEYIEAIASGDDGIQIFGGMVDLRNIAAIFNEEDGLEYDQGWQGRGQFIFTITDELNGAGEHAGDYEGDDYEEFDVDMTFMPYSNPLLYNQTYIGAGQATAIRLHNGAGVRLHNSLFVNFGLGIDFEDEDPCDAWELLLFGETNIQNNRFWQIGDSSSISELILYDDGYVFNGQEEVEAHFTDNNNFAYDPVIDFTFETNSGHVLDAINLTPDSTAMAVDSEFLPEDAWFESVDYIGAFSPNGGNWLTCWTYAEQLGLFGAWNNDEGNTEADVLGCTYLFACNFNDEATLDDGSCEIESCAGCTWPNANNYNPDALFDDGSCTGGALLTCPSDINQDGMVNTGDLLIFLGAFGEECIE